MTATIFWRAKQTRSLFDSAAVALCRPQFSRGNCPSESETVSRRAVFSPRLRGSMRVFAAIVFVYVIQACAAAQIRDQEAERFAAKISSLVDRLAQRQSSLKQLEDILGGEIFEQQQGRYAIIKSPQHNTLAAIEEQGGDSVVTELVIYPKSDLKLTFQDLQVTMGKWQIDQEYQASSPVFECVSADRKILVSVYVTLLFPPTDPISRIVSIRIQVASTETEKG